MPMQERWILSHFRMLVGAGMSPTSATSATLTRSSSQLAQGQDGSFRRFAVLEFATAEMAEEARRLTDGRLLGGTNIRVSFCAPGVPGRSMLAALIAAQTMVSLHTDQIHRCSSLGCCSLLLIFYLVLPFRLLTGERGCSRIPPSCRYSQVSIILPPLRCCFTRWYREPSRVRTLWDLWRVGTFCAAVDSDVLSTSRPSRCSPCSPAAGQPGPFCCPAPDPASEPGQSPTGTAAMLEFLCRHALTSSSVSSVSAAHLPPLPLPPPCFLFSKPF